MALFWLEKHAEAQKGQLIPMTQIQLSKTGGPRLLAGDIGGTKTDLAIYTLASGPHTPITSGRLPSAKYENLESLVRDFLAQVDMTVDYACFDVAGPVINGNAKLTNLPWALNEAALQQALGVRAVWLLNDLLAIANAVPHLLQEDLYTLNPATPVPGGTIAVIAPGTGLGEAFLTWDGHRYHAYPSEGGHSTFGPINEIQMELFLYLSKQFGHVSYERVCSGLGIPNIYSFFKDSGYAPESPTLAAELAETPQNEKARVIVNAAMDANAPDQLCAATLETFVSILGAETANLMLKVLSEGGVYIAGGIPMKILPALQDDTFMKGVTNKGRLSDVVSQFPIYVIQNPQVALIGVASYGIEMVRAHFPLAHA